MYRNWKKMSALGLAVLLGCTLPMGTILAAENNAEIIQETGDDSLETGTILETENTSDSENTADKENNTSGESTSTADKNNAGADSTSKNESASDDANLSEDEGIQDEVNTDEENIKDEADIDKDQNVDIENVPQTKLLVVKQKAAARGTEAPESIGTPEISITWQGRDLTKSLGSKISYEYINYNMQGFAFEVSASNVVKLSYCLEEVSDMNNEAKGEEQMDFLSWKELKSFGPEDIEIVFLNDAVYVLYVKAEGPDGQVTYARSVGIVGDTKAPEVIGVVEGNAYQEGTLFRIEDTNLESVTVNEKAVALSADGNYQVVASGTSCAIYAKDKAGNNTTCNITVTGKSPATDGQIINSGFYALKKGVPYQLSAGKWKVGGDRTVYAGGSVFYVKADQDYMLTRY